MLQSYCEFNLYVSPIIEPILSVIGLDELTIPGFQLLLGV